MGFREVEVLDVDVLDVDRPIRCLDVLLTRTIFEFIFRETQARLIYCIVRARFVNSPRREDSPQSLNLFRELDDVVSCILTIIFHLSPGIITVRVLV